MNRRVSLYLVLLVVIGLAFNFSDRDETQFAAVSTTLTG